MNKEEILVIDDEAPIRKLLEITLQNNGYKVLQASTAKDGLLTAANHPPDLILLDIGLPDENGQIVLKKFREWYNKPIIILSVLKDEENIVKALDNGANDYLTKPFRTGELLARVRLALRNKVFSEETTKINFGDLSIDLQTRTVKKNNERKKPAASPCRLLRPPKV